MVKHLRTLGLSIAAAVVCGVPFQAFAQLTNNTGINIGGNVGGGDLKAAIVTVLQYVLSFIAIIAVVVIVVAGIRFIISQGEEGEKDKARKTIVYAVIGLIIILLAQAIVNFVLKIWNVA
jgi:hypothetical protein